MKPRHRTILASAATLVGASLLLAGCSPPDAGGGNGEEVVITCTTCADDPSNPFLVYRHAVAEAFNEEFAGRYRIDMLPNVAGGAEMQQSYERMALAGDLPDLFIAGAPGLVELNAATPLMDFAPLFEADPDFAATFYDGIFDYLDVDGQRLGLPEQRDVLGVYYNTSVLEAASVDEPPTTWDDFRDVAESVKESGGIPIAADGLFVTMLWTTHLIGTAEGGADYLRSDEVAKGGFEDNDLWIDAVEYVRDLHLDGLVNSDAFGGDFQRASAPWMTGEAGTITNGPWYIPQIEAEASPGVFDSTIYVPAPGDGAVIFGGDAAWASAADTPETQEAVWEFMKFAYSFDEQFRRTVATGSFGPVIGAYTEEQRAELPPLAVGLVEQSGEIENTYPFLQSILPQPFLDAWLNYWPAYAQGSLDTTGFLTQLSDSLEG